MNIYGVVSSEFLENGLANGKEFLDSSCLWNGKLPMDGKLPLSQNFWNRNSGL